MVAYRRTDGPGIFEGVSSGLAAAGVVPIVADGALPPLPLYLTHRKEIELTLARSFIDVAVSFNLP